MVTYNVTASLSYWFRNMALDDGSLKTQRMTEGEKNVWNTVWMMYWNISTACRLPWRRGELQCSFLVSCECASFSAPSPCCLSVMRLPIYPASQSGCSDSATIPVTAAWCSLYIQLDGNLTHILNQLDLVAWPSFLLPIFAISKEQHP